jgi:uncharacterized membrane protein YjgN (DUF898 family)
MNDQTHDFVAEEASAFRFTGRWQEFLPIALTNLLLTVVTLGIYRFWAKARERRYLWSRTEFIDETLEWTGTGAEMFKGFLVAIVLLAPALFFFQTGFQAMVLRGQGAIAGAIALVLYLGILGLGGVARYRALRYRLSRTYWHGIRGGGEPGGWAYGASFVWKTLAGFFALSLLVPWSAISLWNERWSAMSFGPHRFEANATTDGLMGRWLLLLISPFLALLIAGVIGAATGAFSFDPTRQPGPVTIAVTAFAFLVAFYLVIALIGVGYFAAYLRNAVSGLELGEVRFTFTATSGAWLKLFLGHAALVVATLGIGFVFIGYRNWSFFIRHLEAAGEIDLDMLTQSTTTASGDAEGLAAAFDIGAL